jgi:hypothetical protein
MRVQRFYKGATKVEHFGHRNQNSQFARVRKRGPLISTPLINEHINRNWIFDIHSSLAVGQRAIT